MTVRGQTPTALIIRDFNRKPTGQNGDSCFLASVSPLALCHGDYHHLDLNFTTLFVKVKS